MTLHIIPLTNQPARVLVTGGKAEASRAILHITAHIINNRLKFHTWCTECRSHQSTGNFSAYVCRKRFAPKSIDRFRHLIVYNFESLFPLAPSSSGVGI